MLLLLLWHCNSDWQQQFSTLALTAELELSYTMLLRLSCAARTRLCSAHVKTERRRVVHCTMTTRRHNLFECYEQRLVFHNPLQLLRSRRKQSSFERERRREQTQFCVIKHRNCFNFAAAFLVVFIILFADICGFIVLYTFYRTHFSREEALCILVSKWHC